MAKETASIYLKLQSGDATKNIDNIAKAFTQARREARLAEKGSKEYVEATRRVRELKGELDAHNKLLGRTGGAWSNVKNIMLGVFGGNLITSGIRAIGGALRDAGQTIMNFQDANANLNAILGVTREETAALREQQIQLGSTTAFTASQAADAQTELAKLGFTMREITNMTPAVLDLAAAAGTDLATAAEIAGATMRGFGLDSSETGRVVDVMAKSFGSSALDINKFQVAMRTVAPVAKNANLSIEQTTSLIGVLIDRGVRAETAGTGLRNILGRLAQSGMTWNDAMNEINSSTDSTKTAIELFGLEASTMAIILAQNADAAGDLEAKLMDAGGAAKAMAEEQLNTLSGDVIKLTSAWEGFILSVENGEGIISTAARGIVQSLTEILNVTNDPDLTFFERMTSLLGGLTPGLAGAKMEAEGLSMAIKAMRANADAMASDQNVAGLEDYRQGLIAQRDAAKEGSMQYRLLNKEIERTLKLQQDIAAEIIGGTVTQTPEAAADPETGKSTTPGKVKTPEEIRAEKAKLALEALKQSYEEEKLYLAEDRLQGIISEEQYQQELTALKIASLLFEKEALQELGMETTSVEQKIADERIAIINQLDKARKKSAEQAERLAEAEKKRNEDLAKAEKARLEAARLSAVMTGVAAADGAESIEEGAKRSLNAIRGMIKGYVAEALASVVANSLISVPPPFGLILAAASGAAASILFDQLVPAFAKGTDYAPGGMALVGEEGPELVNLPRGSQVFTAPQTQTMLAGGEVFGSRFTGNTTPPPSVAPQIQKSNDTAGVEALIDEVKSWQREFQVVFSNRSKTEFDQRLSEAEKPVKFRK